MEERVPPPPPPPPPSSDAITITHANHHHHLLPDSQQAFGSGTYVVQVPKDQIYRVPPPENALIAERYRTPTEKSKSYRSRCLIICILICFIAVFVALAAVVSSRLINPKTPTFQIQNLAFTNSSRSPPRYKITLKAENPNSKTSIIYGDGGHASLSFKQQEIADGDCPTFSQGFKDSTVFALQLNGSKTALPKEIERSVKGGKSRGQTSLTLSLSMDYPIKRKVWFFKTSKRLAVSCNVTVDKLGKGTRVLSQECHS